MLLQQFLQPLAIGTIRVERRRNIHGHQFLAGLITRHSQQRIVEIQEASLRSGDKHTFLNTGDQRAVFFLGALSIGNILQNVHGSELQAGWICKCRVGSEEKAGQPWIGLVALSAHSFAVGAKFVRGALRREEFRNASAD